MHTNLITHRTALILLALGMAGALAGLGRHKAPDNIGVQQGAGSADLCAIAASAVGERNAALAADVRRSIGCAPAAGQRL